jgi:hypothetical protein
MASVIRIPNLQDIAAAFIGRPYAEEQCWQLVYDLLQAGGFADVATEPAQAIAQVAEIWFCDDSRNPLGLLQPWDWLLFAKTGMPRAGAPVGHVGLVVDESTCIHVRPGLGACLEPLRRMRPKLVQVARLRCLL